MMNMLTKPVLPPGFAECLYSGPEGRFNCMVMELLGKSLEDMVQECKGKLNVASTLLTAEQILRRIEYLHSRGVIHRDIKPENFMFGRDQKIHHLYMIDFGLSKKYWDNNQHSKPRNKLSLTGTARYASINAHKGLEQSRRDDLEAIGHMLLYFLRGVLPWSGLEARTQEEKYRKIKEKKEDTPLDELCKGFPEAFQKYLRGARQLDFKERPDYDGYRKMFRDVRKQDYQNLQDHEFQWFAGKDMGKLVPLGNWDSIPQPDDQDKRDKVRSDGSGSGNGTSMGCCFICGGKSGTKE